ncbi:fumarylacetoacetate hydrolase family protein [Siccirubricoccus sp. KC 17139]|uniref:Fumarylacetoacetate hydrolase family protein n=1 Tax=Siccirubricoccus soli TaxID=2899147 RepID=A0ABT1D9F0_9PROT|nr:fumarylacetoacetate hydrolase family protein [Siccirubricoccus soli]MCO6418504.1 fumarylacetoacetate hydrolase family protein [Siccirubricoccus soli]MCP2684639.1 fumarylacetoacetate hydrolase family protein [Siccirubricoccus soli]
MRLVTFKYAEKLGVHLGALREDGAVLDLAAADPALQGGNMPAFIAGGTAALEHARSAMAKAPVAQGAALCAPIPRPPKNVFCVGKNYHEHAKEFAGSGFDGGAKDVVPPFPVVFSKPHTSIIAPGEKILSALDPTGGLDYEGELAVVIGRRGRGIGKAEAMQHVFGYTIVNDVTARHLQKRHSQWVLGKGLDTFCPMGPAILTADAVPDPKALRLTAHVNGEKRQDALVADLIFDIPALIEAISAGITLEPGDVIATGTPVGVGIGFTPPRFLKAGDVVRIEVTGIGVLENPVA